MWSYSKYTQAFSLQPSMAIPDLKIVYIFLVLTPNELYNPFHLKPQNKPKQNTSSTCQELSVEWYGCKVPVHWLITDHS